jgi:hypothetical protein
MFDVLNQIAADTLMKRDEDGVLRWSRTSLTMFTAMFFTVLFAVADFIMNGLRFDVWATFVAMSMGIKVTDAWSKKLGK